MEEALAEWRCCEVVDFGVFGEALRESGSCQRCPRLRVRAREARWVHSLGSPEMAVPRLRAQARLADGTVFEHVSSATVGGYKDWIVLGDRIWIDETHANDCGVEWRIIVTSVQ